MPHGYEQSGKSGGLSRKPTPDGALTPWEDKTPGNFATRYLDRVAEAAAAQSPADRMIGPDLRGGALANLIATLFGSAVHRGIGAGSEVMSLLSPSGVWGEPRLPGNMPEWRGYQTGGGTEGPGPLAAAGKYALETLGALDKTSQSRAKDVYGGEEMIGLEHAGFAAAEKAEVPLPYQIGSAFMQPGLSNLPRALTMIGKGYLAAAPLAVVPRAARRLENADGTPRAAVLNEAGEEVTGQVIKPGSRMGTDESGKTTYEGDVDETGSLEVSPTAKGDTVLDANLLAKDKWKIVLKDGSLRKGNRRIKSMEGGNLVKREGQKSGAKNHVYADEIEYRVPSSPYETRLPPSGKTKEPSIRTRSYGDVWAVGDSSKRVKVGSNIHTLHEKLVVVPKGEKVEGGTLLTTDVPIPTPKPRRGMKAVPNLRETGSPAAALKIAQNEPHLLPKKDKSGYTGGPPGVRDRNGILKMREAYDELVELGHTRGADWYKRMREQAKEIAGKRAHQYSEEGALFSPQSKPVTEMSQNLDAHNAWEAGGQTSERWIRGRDGEPGRWVPIVRTQLQTRKHRQGRLTGDYDPSLKTGPYGGARGDYPSIGGTHDIWDARSWGWPKTTNKAPGETEHMFMDYETVLAVERANKKKLGGRSNWTADEIQASAWVAQGGKDRLKQFNGDLDAAMDSMNDTGFAEKFAYYLTHETAPYRGSGHLPGLDQDELGALAADPAASWIDPETGHDVLVEATGLYQLPARGHRGHWETDDGTVEFNRATTSLPLVPPMREPIRTIGDVRGPGRTSADDVDSPLEAGVDMDLHGNLGEVPVITGQGATVTRPASVYPHDVEQLSGIEHFRAAMDVQGMGAGHQTTARGQRGVLGRDAPVATVSHGALSEDNLVAMSKLRDEVGFHDMITRSGGTTFIDWKLMEKMSDADPKVVRKAVTEMRKRLERMQSAIEELGLKGVLSEPEAASWSGLVADYGGMGADSSIPGGFGYKLAPWRANEGIGIVTRTMLDNIPQRLRDRIDASPAIRRVVFAKAERDLRMSTKTGKSLREDVQNLRRIFVELGLAGVQEALDNGAFLPALVTPLIGAVISSLSEDPQLFDQSTPGRQSASPRSTHPGGLL